jgi:hypothetical protein
MRRLTLATLLAVLTALPAAAQQPVHVYVSARTAEALAEPERKAREKETDAEHERAEEARKGLQKTLEAQHGKNGQAWPEEARGQLDAAWQRELQALVAHQEVKTEQKDLDNGALALTNALKAQAKKSPHLALAASADQADLAVEVLARRAKTSFPAAAWFFYLKVKPERLGDAKARFAGTSFGQIKTQQAYLGQIMGMQKLQGGLATVHPFSEAEPYWVIEVGQQGTSYWGAALAAADALVGFAAGLNEPAEQARSNAR